VAGEQKLRRVKVDSTTKVFQRKTRAGKFKKSASWRKNMIWVIYLFIALWAIIGVLALLVPKTAKNCMLKFSQSGPFWLWGVIALVVGYIFWQSTALVSIPLVMQVLAVIAVIKGLTFLLVPKSKVEGLLSYWLNISDIAFRVLGILLLLLAYYLFQILV